MATPTAAKYGSSSGGQKVYLSTASSPAAGSLIVMTMSISPTARARPAPPNQSHGHGHKRTTSVEVSESARLELVVPQASNLDITSSIDESKVLKSTGKSSIAAVAHIEQRDSLFYGGLLYTPKVHLYTGTKDIGQLRR